MTSQSIPQEKIHAKGLTRKEYMKEYNKRRYEANKEKLLDQHKKYRRSKSGLIAKIYGGQIKSSKKRNHPMPDYGFEELRAWVFLQPNFEALYHRWIISGFSKNLIPSCDRLDDYKPYTLDNLRLVTWAENNARGYADSKNGVNNKKSKEVVQLTKDGEVVTEHHSVNHASRVTGVDLSMLSKCCNGKCKTAGGFLWEFI